MNLEDDILIERFLRNELSEVEKHNFFKRVEVDKEFEEYYVFEKQLYETLNENEWSFVEKMDSKEIDAYVEVFEDEESKNLERVLQKVGFDYKNKKTKVVKLVASLATIAAMVLIVLNIFINPPADNKKLYADNIALDELSSSATRGDENSSDLIEAENLFKEKKYKESLAIFNKEISIQKGKSSIYIYKAIAHTELNQYKKAVLVLDKLIASDLIDAEKGYWYKSLVYVKSNQLKKAKKTLKIIVDNSYYKKQKSKELLEKL